MQFHPVAQGELLFIPNKKKCDFTNTTNWRKAKICTPTKPKCDAQDAGNEGSGCNLIWRQKSLHQPTQLPPSLTDNQKVLLLLQVKETPSSIHSFLLQLLFFYREKNNSSYCIGYIVYLWVSWRSLMGFLHCYVQDQILCASTKSWGH